MNFDIIEGDIFESDSWLGGTSSFFIERVKHASWSVPVGLFHLLGTDIDCPPDWSVHCEVGVVDILNQACALIAGVGFYIYAFEGTDHLDVAESNVTDTVATQLWGYTSDCHPHS